MSFSRLDGGYDDYVECGKSVTKYYLTIVYIFIYIYIYIYKYFFLKIAERDINDPRSLIPVYRIEHTKELNIRVYINLHTYI